MTGDRLRELAAKAMTASITDKEISRLIALAPDMAVLLADAIDALAMAVDCKGSYAGTVTERGGDPAICTKCESEARALLARFRALGDT